MDKNENFFIQLHLMCAHYGKPPCDYLFPDVECPHFRLMVDTLVFNIGYPKQEEMRWKRAALASGAGIKGLNL